MALASWKEERRVFCKKLWKSLARLFGEAFCKRLCKSLARLLRQGQPPNGSATGA